MEKHVLLIDDDEDELEIFQDAVNKAGLPFRTNCIQLENIEDAISYLENFKVDFVFVDYNMPKTNGLQSLTIMKQSDSCNGVPIIIYSTFIDNDIEEEAMHLGASYFLRKPFKNSTLSRKLRSILSASA